MTEVSLEFRARNGAWFGVLAIRDVVATGDSVTQLRTAQKRQ
jgi:hypothetical protein